MLPCLYPSPGWVTQLGDGLVIICFSHLIGTGEKYILDGQHKYSAASVLREDLHSRYLPVPGWMTFFPGRRPSPSVPLYKHQLVAGREQARTSTIMQQSLSQNLVWFLKEAKEANPTTMPSKTGLLHKVYLKCGCTKASDGSVVCPVLPSLLCLGPESLVMERDHAITSWEWGSNIMRLPFTCLHCSPAVPLPEGHDPRVWVGTPVRE